VGVVRTETVHDHTAIASGRTTESRIRTLTAIREISQKIVGAFDLQDLLERVVGTLAELSKADACSIWLIDPDGKVRIKAAKGYHERLLAASPDYQQALKLGKAEEYCQGLRIPAEYSLDEALTGQIARTGNIVRTTGVRPHQDQAPQWQGKYDKVQWPQGGHVCKCFLGAPLKIQERIIGIVKVENKRESNGVPAEKFDEEDEEVLTILANVIAVTIENQRLAEERRKQAEQTWRLISARLAHKIGNQNFAAKGLLRSTKKLKLSDDGNELIRGIQACCDSIDVVVNEAKTFSGPLTIRPTHCGLGKFVEKTVRSYSIEDWQAEFRFGHEEGEGPLIELDETQMRQVLMELLENSQGFKKENAFIEIRTGRATLDFLSRCEVDGEFAFIDYTDNGPGIPDHQKKAIFEPFVSFRQGSGLGLSIVRQIVEAHGGRIVEFGKPKLGARFLILLPSQTHEQLT
jgi:signal transduction histidine kinase